MTHSIPSTYAWLACSALIAGLATACGSSLPAVLTSTPATVAIEFSTDGSLTGTRDLAIEECAKYGLIPRFDVVEKTATPSSRVAKYQCVSPNVAAPPAAAPPAAMPSTAEPAATSETEPAAAETDDAAPETGATDTDSSEASTE
ncbi:MAG: hypothetical protein JRG92_11260 [Deltaproteobacteria bacterium]|nr:hypothetical protein [Deltaproteobacteria bacterium]MBW2384205.1 hypothetical protein [Deltaproteobacteria bacterium]MBW2694854.1 hypothetical protein [Deltaproteobacteria bacterium]